MTNHRQYAECSRLLIAIADFFQYFAEFKDIPKIEALKVSVEESKRLLEESIIEDFKRFSMSSEKLETEALENLQAACVVIDVLGEHAAKSLAEWISKKQLEAFVMIFDVPSEPIHFENFEKRYSWLRRQLQKLMTSFGPIFPKSWNIPGRICLDFSNLAHKHLLKLLSDLRDQKLLDVQLLIRVLQRTIAFEEELDHYYSKVGVVQLYYDLDPDKFDDSGDPNSSELTKRQFRDKKLEQELLTKQGDDTPKAKPMSFSAVPRNMKFKGLISKAFWGFMSIYVELERQNFTKLIDKINREEEWFVSEVKEDRRLSGSDEFFLYIKKSLERCAKFENRKVTFDVYVEYKRGVRLYADLLHDKIPKKADNSVMLKREEMILLCLIVNTCQYCIEVIPSLQESIIKHVDSALQTRVVFEEESDYLHEVINKALDCASLSVLNYLDPCLVNMEKQSWGTWEAVGDTSAYVKDIRNTCVEQLSIISGSVGADYHVYVCTNVAKAFVPRFVTTIAKCKRINDSGAQQLLLDSQDIEVIMCGLPRIGSQDDSETTKVPKNYVKAIKRDIGKAVMVLKTISSPLSATSETFLSLFKNGNVNDLARILDIKGIKKFDQQHILDAYNKKVPVTEQAPALFGSEDLLKKFIFF